MFDDEVVVSAEKFAERSDVAYASYDDVYDCNFCYALSFSKMPFICLQSSTFKYSPGSPTLVIASGYWKL